MNRRKFLQTSFAVCAAMTAPKSVLAAKQVMYDVPATKVNDRCYYIQAKDPEPSPDNQAFFNNPGFVVTSKGVVVVDTGSSVQIGEMVLRQIRKVTDRPVVAVINTHYHGDHWLGNHAFVESNPVVGIYSHQQTIDRIKNGRGEFWYNFMQRNSDNAITGTIITPPNKSLSGGEVLQFGDTQIKVHQFGKAHTECDLMIEVVESRTVYVGDTAMRRIANIADGSYLGTIQAMDQAIKIGAKSYISGHGKHDDVSLCKDMKHFCEVLYGEVSKHYDNGLTDYEMKEEIIMHPQIRASARQWPGFNESIGKYIAVAVAEVESNLF